MRVRAAGRISETPACRVTIGPNAVIQLAAALAARGHGLLARETFAAAGMPDWLDMPPREMVPEESAARLHQAVRAALPAGEADAVLREAGRLTADYLLAHRIPPGVQIVLRILPPLPAAKILAAAIQRNAWTFVGSGRFRAHAGHPTVLEIVHNPLCAGEHASSPVCAWHQAVFEHLFRSLVSKHAEARETACEAAGHATCRFIVEW